MTWSIIDENGWQCVIVNLLLKECWCRQWTKIICLPFASALFIFYLVNACVGSRQLMWMVDNMSLSAFCLPFAWRKETLNTRMNDSSFVCLFEQIHWFWNKNRQTKLESFILVFGVSFCWAKGREKADNDALSAIHVNCLPPCKHSLSKRQTMLTWMADK